MKKLFIVILCICSTALSAAADTREVEKLLSRLDSMVAQKDRFTALKEERISQLRHQRTSTRLPEERYWQNKLLYDEFFVYDSDSAMVYVLQNIEIARGLAKKDWVVEWKIKKAFLLSATGLLKEALDELDGISGKTLSPALQVEFYGQMMYLFSHFGQYTGDKAVSLRDDYYWAEQAYKDSVCAVITETDPMYLWYKGWNCLGTDSAAAVKQALRDEMAVSKFQTRTDAMNAYILARLCLEDGQTDDFLKYMACSAMADVRISNKDIASLEELAKALFERGDIDRAHTYINYCLQNAQLYQNRVRVVGMSQVMDDIRVAYYERNQQQEARLHIFLVVVSVLSVVLFVAILYILRQMKRLKKSRVKLNEVNRLLNEHVQELSQAHTSLAEANDRLKSLNEQLKEANGKLRESNYVKEEYIGYVFALCSNYISKLDEYRKNINRKVKAKQFDEVKALTDSPTMAHNELKEFYHNFDAIFLHVYPDFVSDFNALLQPESRIVLKEGELLNTDLRIYALVRLGINDSVKIAEFLHCSPQTVYNNRLKTRNKAIIPKEDFANTVRSLGKMQE